MPRKRDPSKPPASPRRRSHHGCQRCRRHKIRCDEARPRCGACSSARGGPECVFAVTLKWEADYAHGGRAFGRAGVWSKGQRRQHASAAAGATGCQGVQSRRQEEGVWECCGGDSWLPVRVESYSFLNCFMRDFEDEEDVESICVEDAPSSSKGSIASSPAPSTALPHDDSALTRHLDDPLLSNLQLADPHLVSYYVYRLCPLTVPCADHTTRSPFSALLVPFALSSPSPATLDALLGLAASHRSRSEPAYQPVAIAYYRRTVRAVRALLAAGPAARLVADPEIMALVMLLCQHELIRDGGSSWIVHLRGARDLIHLRKQQQQQQRQQASGSSALERRTGHNSWEQITAFAERFFAFYDVMGRTACGEEPMFGSEYWSVEDDAVDPWMGCSPRMVNIISAVTELSWTLRRVDPHSGVACRQDVAVQRERLEALLVESHAEESRDSRQEGDAMSRCVELKRLTVQLYIQAALTDSTPSTPTVRHRVSHILRLVAQLLALGVRAGLTWPLFMTACQLEPTEELDWTAESGQDDGDWRDVPRFARPFILYALDQLADTLSSVARTRLVIEKVWKTREAACVRAAAACPDEEAFNDWACFVAPLCHNISVV